MSKQLEAVQKGLKGLTVQCNKVLLAISRCDTKSMSSEDAKLLYWIRRFAIGANGTAESYQKKVTKSIDKENTENHE